MDMKNKRDAFDKQRHNGFQLCRERDVGQLVVSKTPNITQNNENTKRTNRGCSRI